MQSGRILPTFRHFFATASNATAKTGQSSQDSNPQQGGQGHQRERDATEEEAKRVAELLLDSEEFKKNGITVQVSSDQGKPVIIVTDKSGQVLRTIQSHEVTRILFSFGMPQSPRQGRILDRRI